MKRKTLHLIMALVLAVSLMPAAWLSAFAEDLTISTLAELEAFRDSVNAGNDYSGATVTLTADIDLGGQENNQWTPIGTVDAVFAGTFDGGGHEIKGLYINRTGYNYLGLFGINTGTIQNLGVEGSVSGSSYIGGIVGKNDNGSIIHCYHAGPPCRGYDLGGIAGVNYGGTITGCYNTGDLNSSGYTGGIVGTTSGPVTNCYNTGTITFNGADGWIGGIAGCSYVGGTINNCYNIGDVFASLLFGGIVGQCSAPLENCYNTGVISGGYDRGGIAASDPNGYTKNCYYLTGTAPGGISRKDFPGMAEPLDKSAFTDLDSFANWDFTDVWTVRASLDRPILRTIPEQTGSSPEDPYLISTVADLETLRDNVNAGDAYYGKYIKLTTDIDLGGSASNNWTPIGAADTTFAGTFDGGNHKITGLYINRPLLEEQGLFGYNTGTIQNLGVEGFVIGGNTAGGIVGRNAKYGSLINCYNAAAVNGSKNIGGVVGWNNDGEIKDCHNTGGITGTNIIGGVAGLNDERGTVTNCYNTASISGCDNLGGIIGQDNYYGSVIDCRNTGDITGDNKIGGVVGNVDYPGGKVSNCYNTGRILGKDAVGGIAGNHDGDIIKSYNTGKISGNSNVGGIFGGTFGDVTDCYNTGSVSGDENVGGISGSKHLVSTTFKNCYNTGVVSGSENVGNLIGNLDSDRVTNCFYLAGTSLNGAGNSADVAGQMKALDKAAFAVQTNFTDWNFMDTWEMNKTFGRPVLREVPEDAGGEETNPVLISTLAELEAFRDSVKAGNDYSGETVTLAADIELEVFSGIIAENKFNWTAIGSEEKPFAGTFDGGGHEIRNLQIAHTSLSQSPKNLGLFGYNTGTIRNLSVTGTVSGTVGARNNIGGIVGYNLGTVTNCVYTGKVMSGENSGGIAGVNRGTVTECHVAGSIHAAALPHGNGGAGGIAGENRGTVSGCCNISSVDGYKGYAGGISGTNYDTVKGCYNTGTVSGGSTGGVVGMNDSTVADCYNTGAAEGASAGGVVGCDSDIRGGDNTGTITNCYNAGNVSGSSAAGGIVGNIYEKMNLTNCYYLTGTADAGIGETAEDVTLAQPTAMDKAAFAQQSSFDAWDFETTWEMNESLGRPILHAVPERGEAQVTKKITAVCGKTMAQDLSECVKIEGAAAAKNAYVYTVISSSDKRLTGSANGDILTVSAMVPAGEYTLTICAAKRTNAAEIFTFDIAVTVEKANPVVTPPVGKTGLVYNGKAQQLITAGSTTGGTMQYSLDGKTYSEAVPTAVDVKTYTVYYKVTGDNYYNDVAPKSLSVTISNSSSAGTGGGPSGGGGGRPSSGGGGGGGGGSAAIAPVTPTPTPDSSGTDNPPAAGNGAFADVSSDAWYYAPVQYVFEKGLMTGVSSTAFEPEAEVTRAMFVTVLYRMENQPDLSNEILGYPFADVDAESWYGDAVYWARLHGIVSGVSDEAFAPDENITREQMAAILYRYGKYKGQDMSAGGTLNYADANVISDYAMEATVWAANKGILQGNEDNTFAPAANATRAQAAAVFQRTLQQMQ